MRMVWAEVLNGTFITRIQADPLPRISTAARPVEVRQMPRADAVGAIRRFVFGRSHGECEGCGALITWKTMHLHEVQPKGKGGEVSIWNCVAICYECHLGRPDSAHGYRRPRFGESVEES